MKNTIKSTRKPIVLDVYSPTRREEQMSTWLSGRLIGQPDARSAAVRIYTMALSILKDPEKAAALVYLLGEPGVGKTELVKLLAEFIHGNRKAYVKIDGASLMDKTDATRLIGASPKYVGYEDPKEAEAREAKEAEESAKNPDDLARKYKKNPRKLLSRKNLVNSRMGSKVPLTILFVDEAEKMNKIIDDLFLNAIEDGVMLLGDNEEVEFGDVLVIFAGNPGSEDAVNRKDRIGFMPETTAQREQGTLDIIMGALKSRYRPEMLDRFDEFVYFKKLLKEDLRTITRLRIGELITRFMQTMSRGTAFTLVVEDSARDFMLEEALKNTGNARRIGRAVRKYFTNPLNRLITQATEQDSELLITAEDKVRVSHDATYHDGKLLKFELFEDEGDVAPQDTIAPSKNDTPLAMKFAGFDRQVTAAAARAKGQPKSTYSVTLAVDSRLKALEEWQAAESESSSILRMDFVDAKVRMKAPWAVTFYYEVTEEQAELLKQHYPNGQVTFVGKASVPPADGGSANGSSKKPVKSGK
jgi:energy-coupling factor transporter ATP-binding protein EcfA2